MSAFSRGHLLRHQCLRSTLFTCKGPTSSRPLLRTRFFTNSPLLSAAPKTAFRAAPSKVTPTPLTYQSYATSLALKSSPTLLYQAPSHTYFQIASYLGASFCFGYSIYNLNINYANAPANISPWIPYAFAGVCFLMSGLGGYLLLSPARLIASISAVPTAYASLSSPTPLKVQITLRRMFPIPFMAARTITTTPASLTLDRPIYTPMPNAQHRSAASGKEMRKRREEWQEDKAHIMTMPFRQMSRGIYKLVKSISRTWSRDGFLKLGVDGQIYKLDVTGGWALDEGRALDKLVKLKVRYRDL